MEYTIERAIHANNEVYNIGDTILVYLEENKPIKTRLEAIYWQDEYDAYIVTTHGKFLLKDILRLV